MIDYGKVQSKVNLKYDSWHKEVLSKFGQMLGSNMTEFHSQISKSRQELEQHSVDTASTSDAVTFITYVQSLKRKIKQFEKQVELYRNGQRLLENKGSSSRLLGFTLTTSRVSGGPSMTSCGGRTLPFSNRWQTCK